MRASAAWLRLLLLTWTFVQLSRALQPAQWDREGVIRDGLDQEAPYDRMADLIVSKGYPLEEHFVTTDDGYILRLFRIKHGRRPAPSGAGNAGQQAGPGGGSGDATGSSSSGAGGGKRRRRARAVVHLQHGLLGSSADWAINGPGFSLAFTLADAGHDVWLGNVRANAYSRNHTRLSPADPAFWAFTWDDIAARDLPAMLSYELETTGEESLAYVGHSQGTTVLLALLSSNPDWAPRVRLAALLAPVAFATHVASPPLVALAKLNTDEVFSLLGVSEFLPSSEVLSRLDGQFCRLEPHMCINLLAMICGYNLDNVDVTRLPVYLNYTPSGTSVANMAHWSQAVRQRNPRTMAFFDFGTRCNTILGAPRPCNQRQYGQLAPPRYNLSRIATPLALFTGGQDRLSDPEDVSLLMARLHPEWVLTRRHDPQYAHLDFIWGINAHARVYDEVAALLARAGPPTGNGSEEPPQLLRRPWRRGGGGGGSGDGSGWRGWLPRWWRRR